MATQSGSVAAVDEADLKRRTGEFDVETIFLLDLSDQGLSELGAVPRCLSLRVLNLSCNQLRDVRALSCLIGLEELDLSANLISSLQDFNKLEKLQRLDLPGNNLTTLDSLLPLCGLPHLTSLCLRVHGTTSLSNPLCSAVDQGGYDLFMRQSFPHLHWLDGERMVERGGVRGEKVELERELGKLEAVGGAGEREREPDSPDPLVGFSLNDELAMEKIKRLLSECSHTSQRVQEHINSLQKDILN